MALNEITPMIADRGCHSARRRRNDRQHTHDMADPEVAGPARLTVDADGGSRRIGDADVVDDEAADEAILAAESIVGA